jgi:DNA-binding response OmpR family regulator
VSKLVLLVEDCPELRRGLNAALLKRGLEVWPVPDDIRAHQVISLEGPRIAVAVIGSTQKGGAKTKALVARVRELNDDVRIICGCAGAAQNARKTACGGVIWPRTACPDLLADLVVAMIEGEDPSR